MKSKWLVIISCSLLMVAAGICPNTRADTINFDDQGLSGPNAYYLATPKPQHLNISTSLGTVQFDGGVILTDVPAIHYLDPTSIYGSSWGFADPISGIEPMTNPMTITLPANMASFSIDVFNGISGLGGNQVGFKVYDNNGNSATFTLPDPGAPNSYKTVNFSNPGTTIYVQCLWPDPTSPDRTVWDLYVDNISFLNQVAPVPGSIVLLGSGLLGLAGWRRFRKS